MLLPVSRLHGRGRDAHGARRLPRDRREFARSLLLPDEIDGENIAATVEHGLLTLTLNVHPKAQPKKIAVSFSGS